MKEEEEKGKGRSGKGDTGTHQLNTSSPPELGRNKGGEEERKMRRKEIWEREDK